MLVRRGRLLRNLLAGNLTREGRSASAAGAHLGPGIAQTDRPVEHQATAAASGIAAEIALALELERSTLARLGEGGFDPAVAEHFERIRSEIPGKLGRVGIRAGEQLIIEPHFRRYGV